MSSAARTIIRALWLAAAVQGQIAGNSMTASDIARMLELHNQFRAMYSQPPLVWNTDLEADASLQTEAVNAQQVNARDCLGGNGFQPHGNLDSQLWKGQLIRVGQNEASGTLGAFQSIDSIFYAWASETPEILRNPLTTDHASQILWYGSTDIGCYRIENQCDAIICDFAPAGNMMGMPWYGPNGPPKNLPPFSMPTNLFDANIQVSNQDTGQALIGAGAKPFLVTPSAKQSGTTQLTPFSMTLSVSFSPTLSTSTTSNQTGATLYPTTSSANTNAPNTSVSNAASSSSSAAKLLVTLAPQPSPSSSPTPAAPASQSSPSSPPTPATSATPPNPPTPAASVTPPSPPTSATPPSPPSPPTSSTPPNSPTQPTSPTPPSPTVSPSRGQAPALVVSSASTTASNLKNNNWWLLGPHAAPSIAPAASAEVSPASTSSTDAAIVDPNAWWLSPVGTNPTSDIGAAAGCNSECLVLSAVGDTFASSCVQTCLADANFAPFTNGVLALYCQDSNGIAAQLSSCVGKCGALSAKDTAAWQSEILNLQKGCGGHTWDKYLAAALPVVIVSGSASSDSTSSTFSTTSVSSFSSSMTTVTSSTSTTMGSSSSTKTSSKFQLQMNDHISITRTTKSNGISLRSFSGVGFVVAYYGAILL